MKLSSRLLLVSLSMLLSACAGNNQKQATAPTQPATPQLRWTATITGTDPSSAPTIQLNLMRTTADKQESIAQGTCIGSATPVEESGSAATMRCNWENGGGDLGAFVEGDQIQINYRSLSQKTGTGQWTHITSIQNKE